MRDSRGVGFLRPIPPPYDPIAWSTLPFAERARMVCESWALQGYGTPLAVYLVYLLKVGGYVAGWLAFCAFTPALADPTRVADWWLHPIAFQKAIAWSMLFEVLGLGCGSGPLTGRYFPPIGGFLYFLRPGTTKLPALRGAWPFGNRRTVVDVLVYAALLGALGWALTAAAPPREAWIAIALLVPVAGLLDKTIFLAARSEHYWVTVLCFAITPHWIAGAKAIQAALWFFAGVSKLNHHFPTVVCVMVSNGPLTRLEALRRAMYRDYPRDLRPSRLATWMAHAGTALELAVPLVLLFAPAGPWLLVGMGLMLLLHGFITSNVPMGVPIEWNVMVVYGAFALFWAHPEVSAFDLGSAPIGAIVTLTALGLPVLGNLAPSAVSFLLAMRYYAGNWAYSVWLFKGESYRKLDRLTASSPWVYDQLERFYDRATAIALVGKVLAFRLMHLHGRALPVLLPRAVTRFEDYEYLDGEIVAGLALGWNFGDGHLHHEGLLEAIQAQCGFAPGELRCVFVESQPLFGSRLTYRIVDAASGPIEAGALEVDELRARQPWEAPA